MKKSVMVLFGIGLVGLIVLYVVLRETNSVNPQQRPAGVPANAVWAGGSDGGIWFKIEEVFQTMFSKPKYTMIIRES